MPPLKNAFKGRKRHATDALFLLAVQVGSAIASVVTISIAARTLGPHAFGSLALIQAIAVTTEAITAAPSWQSLIRYGSAKTLTRSDRLGLLKFCFSVDVLGATVGALSTAIILLLVPLSTPLAPFYALTAATGLTSTSIGILRLHGNFRQTAWPKLLQALVRLGGSVLAWHFSATLELFLFIWIVSTICGNLFQLYLGLRSMAHSNLAVRDILKESIQTTISKNPGIVGFTVSCSLNKTLRQAVKEADVLIVGVALGPAGAAGAKLFKQFASVMVMAVDPVYQIVFPTFSRHWAEGKTKAYSHLLWRVTGYSTLGSAVALLASTVLAPYIIKGVLGTEYLTLANSLRVYLAGSSIAMATFAMVPAALVSVGSTAVLRMNVAVSILYLCLLAVALPVLDLYGLGLATIIYNGARTFWLARMLRGATRRMGQSEPAHEAATAA